jgi:fatty acid/phospholipid biosynthesis enzyme
VGLVNIGVEEEKGTAVTGRFSDPRAQLPSLRRNVEARDIADGLADVLVCVGSRAMLPRPGGHRRFIMGLLREN